MVAFQSAQRQGATTLINAEPGADRAPTWLVPPRVGEDEQLELGADSLLLAQLLWNRGVRSADQADAFLDPGGAGFADPELMRDVPRAVERLTRALADGETIAVYGDYDVDGVSGAALLACALRRLGGNVRVHLPDRARDGYGVHAHAVRQLAADGARVIITVDCGISANDQVTLAAELGADVVVTDHHTIPAQLPAAAAVLNPHQADCHYPFKNLAGGGVAFQLARAMLARFLTEEQADVEIDRLAPFAALSTVADVMPLIGENRTIVAAGIAALREGLVPGLEALCAEARRRLVALTARDLAFSVIPRLNAAGRMGDARDALDLLLSEDPEVARPIAARLEAANLARRARMDELLPVAELEARAHAGDGAIVLDGDYPVGLAGLVAARISDQFRVPCVVIERGESTSRGSVRGAEGIHLVRALDACCEDLIQYGGHERAAGFSLRSDLIDAFRASFVEAVQHMRSEPRAGRVILADCALRLASVGPRLATLVERFEPTGAGNPVPTFISRGLLVREAGYVRGGHIRMRLAQGMATRRGIAFRPGFDLPAPGSTVDVLYNVERDVWAGQERVELRVQDVRPATSPAVPV